MSERTVLCMKWGTLYSADYVNVLHSAVRRNTTGEVRFVCLTDDAAGLSKGVEAHPIPDIGYDPRHWRGGAWPKLSVFVEYLYGRSGRALFLDLDIVVRDSLDPFFEAPGEFIALAGGAAWGRPDGTSAPTVNTSVFAFDIGGQSQIVKAFQRDPMGAIAEFGIEQRFVERHATSWKAWPAPWIVSFKRHLRRPVLVDRFLPPKEPPAETRIVAFHGKPRPLDLARSGSRHWGEFPHYGRGPVGWVRDYWIENGGGDLHSQSGSER